MNFINQIKTMLFYFVLFNPNIFMTMQNDIVFDLDKEYTNLMLLSNFDSAKQPGIEEEQINLERRMQFRLIAWNFAENYGLENEKKKIARNKKGEIKDMVKYACELWTKTELDAKMEQAKIVQNPETHRQAAKSLRKKLEKDPMNLKEMRQEAYGDCGQLEFQLDDKSDPFEEMPKWVNNFFESANKMHYEAMRKLLHGKQFDEYNFDFCWTEFQKRIQELRDEEQLKKALELEDVEAKMGRSMAIIPFNGSKKRVLPLVEEGNENEESQFLREMRKLALNSITKDGQEEMKLVKKQIIKLTSANTLINLDSFYPILLGIGTLEEQEVLELYKNIIKDTNEAELAVWEFRISAAFLYGRIWRKLFDQLFENQQNEENIRADLKQLFKISEQFYMFTNNINKYVAQKICLELLQLWRKIMGENEGHEMAEEIEENFERNKMIIRNELLWKEHWAWLDLLKKMDKQLLDSNFSPGNIYKFSEFFGGFEQIWSKINEMEKSGQKPFQLNRIDAAENVDYPEENLMDKMLAPFRTKLNNDLRMIYNIEDYIEKIVFIHDKVNLKIRQMMWKTTSNIKRSIWGLDLLIWMLILDEKIDHISTENDDQKLVNAWWNARVEMEIFHDSLAIREKGYEAVEKPALYMLNWMYLLKNQKCITKNEAESKTQIEEFDEKEENRKEFNKDLINYIEKCKKMAKEYTEKEQKHFDDGEIRKQRWVYFKKLISEGERFYSAYIPDLLESQIEDKETLTKLEELIGSEYLAEITEKGIKHMGSRYLVEKYIEILQIPDKKSQFQASLDVMYLFGKNQMNNIKYYAKKYQIMPIAFEREYGRKVYDGITRIEREMENILEMEEKEHQDGGNIPISSRTKNIEMSTDEFSRQINMIRSIKMMYELREMIGDEQSSSMTGSYNFDKIPMASSEFVQANFHHVMEELRKHHMSIVDFKKFASALQSDPKLVKFLRNEVGAVYTLNTLLGFGHKKEKQNLETTYEKLWKELTNKNNNPKAIISDGEKEKRNIEIVWEEASKGANVLGSNLDNPLRDINFFNDKRLLENYALALKNYKLKGENSPTIMHSLAANILVFMQYFEKFVMQSTILLPKLQLIRSKYGEQIRLFARIEYDKVLTDFGEVKFHIQREFFARLLTEIQIKSRSKKEIIPEILHNYQMEKIAVENENDELFKDYDENLQKFHSDAFVHLLRKEKEGKEENKGKKVGRELSIAKILSDAHSDHGKRQILFNFLGNFERIANVFKEIGPHGIKIQTKDYAHFMKGKATEEMENPNEQILRISLPEPLAEDENFGVLEHIYSGRREPPQGFKFLRREPQASEAPKKNVKKSWDYMADSDHSDSDNGEGSERKNVRIQEIAEGGGNEQQRIEEIEGHKKSTKEKEKDKIQMTEEATSSNLKPKGKKKKKVRFHIDDEEASANPPSTNQNDVPTIDVSSGDSNAENSSSKSKKKSEKMKKKIQETTENRAEKEYGKVTILKRGEKEEEITEEEAPSNSPSNNQNDVPAAAVDVSGGEGGAGTSSKTKKKREQKKRKKIQQNQQNQQQKSEKETKTEYGKVTILKREEEVSELVDLPLNEIVEGKFHDHKLPPFIKYLNDQFLYNKFLEIYEKFIAEQKWSPEEHLFLTVGTYLNEINHKLNALEGIKLGKIFLPNSIDWKLLEEMQRELNELNLMEEMEWTLEEINILMTKLHDIFIKLLGQIDGYDNGDGKEKDEEKPFDQNHLRLQLNWICFVRAIFEEKKLEQMWTDVKNQAYNRNFVFLIGYQPIIVVEQGQKKNELKLNGLVKLKTQFEKEYLVPYKQMLEQNAIDRQLMNEYSSNNSGAKNTIPIEFNKLYQQFRWSSDQIRHVRGSTQQIRDSVYNVVVNEDEDEADGPNNRLRYQKVNFAIQRIEHLITKIWAPQSTLKIGGSYQLGTWTPNSDIDAILIASKRVGRERFFGKTMTTCESNRLCLDIDSLFCQLCQNKNVFHLVKYPNNHIPHLKFTYCTHFERHQMDFDRSKLPEYQCTPIELVLVSMPGYGIISEKTLQNTSLLIEQFRERGEEDIYEIDWNDSRAGMIHALSGYQLNEFILEKLKNKNMLRVFRICLVALKKWAQNNHIYGGQYGFLNSASLGLMLLKILLRFPITAMVPFILEQFFVQFVNWPWPLPVQFAPLGADKTEARDKKLGWQAERERGQKQKMLKSKVRHVEGWHLLSTLNMPIISPCKPERNVAYSVNHSTQQIIQRQLKFGLEMIEKIQKQHQQNRHPIIEHDTNANNKYSWKSFLNDKKSFGEKYTHYIVFYCFAKTSSSFEQRDLGEKFCGEYVLYQLRLQLIFSIERNPNTGILRCHILPNVNKEKQQKKNLNELAKKLTEVPPEFRRNSLNRYWIIGLEFADNDKGAFFGRNGNNYAAEKLEKWLNESQFGFVEKFIQDYFNFSMRKHSKPEIYKKLANIHLYAKFVPADQLGQWTILSPILRPKEQRNLN